MAPCRPAGVSDDERVLSSSRNMADGSSQTRADSSRGGTPQSASGSRPMTPCTQEPADDRQSPAGSPGPSGAGGAQNLATVRSVKIKIRGEEAPAADDGPQPSSPPKVARQETAEEREMRTTWGLVTSHGMSAKGKVLVRMGLAAVDVQEEYQALSNLRGSNRRPAPLGQVEECDTWELLGGTCSHNRCYTFGVDQNGQLGQGASTFVGASDGPPVRAPKSVKEGQRFVAVACGQSHTVAVTEEGALYSWGLNEDGQLGLVSPHRQPQQQQMEGQGTALPPIRGSDVTDGPGSGSDTHRPSLLVTGQDPLMELEVAMRNSLPGQLDVTRVVVPKGGKMVSSPVRSWLGVPVAVVACGQMHTVVGLRDTGALAWGSNHHGQLGLGDTDPRRMPVLLPAFNKLRITKLSAGKAHNFAVDSLGRMWSFGANKSGQCGRTPADHMEPEVLSLKDGLGMVKSVACGQAHTLVLLTNGDVFSCGYDAWGSLGLGKSASVDRPVRCFLTRVESLSPCSLVAASSISMAVTTEGTLMVWGRSKWISHPKDEDQARCVPLPLEWLAKEKIASVSCSLESAVALSDDGAIHVWGRKKNLLGSGRSAAPPGQKAAQEAEDADAMEPEMIIGKAVEELCSNVLMAASCGDGFCVILSEREMWDAPYNVLKRAVFALWQQYRTSIGGIASQRARQAAGRGRRRGAADDDHDDGLMTFTVFALLCKETRLVSNRYTVPSLVTAYEKAAAVAVKARNTALPKFLQVADAAAAWRVAPEPAARRPALLERAKTRRWDAAVAAINKLEMGVEDWDSLDAGSPNWRSPEASKDGSTRLPTAASRLKSRRASAAVAEGQMKKISQQINSEKQARLSLLETSLGFSESLDAMMTIAREHMPANATDQEVLQNVALHLSALRHRKRGGPSGLLRECCTPNLIKSVAAKGDHGVLQRIYAYLMSPTPDRDDLNIPLPDLQMALNELGDNIGVSIKRVATFLREALVVPKVVAQYVSLLQEEDDPELYELAQEIAMKESSLAEKAVEDRISQSAVEHRDEMLAKVLLELHGPCPKIDPECVTFPDFLSLVLMLVASKSASNNNKVRREGTIDPAAQDLNYQQVMTKIRRYREKKLHPWKYFDRQRTEAEIQQEVDRVFAMYCTLDTTSYSVEIDQKTFRRFCKDGKLADNKLTITKLDLLFLTNINKEREKQKQVEQASKPPTALARRNRPAVLTSDQSDSGREDGQGRQRPNRPLGTRRRSSAAKGKAPPPPAQPPKLAEVLRKSELGSLVRALKESKADKSGRSQRDAFALAALMIKDREKLRKSFRNISFSVAAASKPAAARQQSNSQVLGVMASRSAGVRSVPSSRGSVGASLTGTAGHQFDKSGRATDKGELSVEEKGSIGQTGKHQGARKRAMAVDRAGFGSILKDIAEAKFNSKRDPFRALVETHLLSLTHSAMDRYDSVMEQLLEPEVNEMAERFSASLQQVFKSYCSMDGNIAYSHAEVTWAMMEEANSTLSFKEFAFMAHDFGIVPNIVTIKELEFIYRRANFSENSDDSIQMLNYSEFIDALGLVAIYGFGKEQFRANYPTSVDKMGALFSFMGFKEGQADEERENRKADVGQEAYKQWWDLLPLTIDDPLDDYAGGGDKAGRTWYYHGTEAYPTCLIPEIVSIPNCPPEVEAHLRAAADLHSQGNFQQALDAYSNALTLWVRLTDELRLTRSGELRPETKLFFAAAVGSVLQSNGQDREAMEQYIAVEKEVRKLPDDHPDIALLHSLIGAAEYHMGHFEEAYKRFVRAKVMRDGLPHLGPGHVDTAVACNNLACVLDKAGFVNRALSLAHQAHRVLADSLGLAHPRTVLVDRNLGHLGQRGFSLDEPTLSTLQHPATKLALARNGKAIERRNQRRKVKGEKPHKTRDEAQVASSRIAKLRSRTQAKANKDLMKRARKYGSKPLTEPEQLKSLYDHMRGDIEKTKQGVLEGAGEILSGELGKGKTLGTGMSMLMMAGFNIRLPEPEKKVKVTTVQVRTTKKFAAAIASSSSTKNLRVGDSTALVYRTVTTGKEDEALRKTVRRPIESSDSSDSSSGADYGSESSSDDSN